MKKPLKKRKAWIISIGLVIASVLYIITQNNWIQVERIEVKISNLPGELQGLKIAQISDVHIPKNASNINKLINKVRKENPDIIVMTGDIIDQSSDIMNSDLGTLCRELSAITDTYAVTGNHEIWNRNVGIWKDILTANNVKVLDNEMAIYKKDNARLAIMGLGDGKNYIPESFNNIQEAKSIPKILLAHRPELFPDYSSDTSIIRPDIVFSGHAHGGQFRIPFTWKGIIAPGQGFFPKYTSGIYTAVNGVRMIVSRGLGNSVIPVRINNRPHIPVIELR